MILDVHRTYQNGASVCICMCRQVKLLHRLQKITVITKVYLLPPATKLGQGYIFTGVCDSVHRGAGCMVPEGMPGLGGAWSRGGSRSRGPGGDTPPPGQLLLRAYRILLECILVINVCCQRNSSVHQYNIKHAPDMMYNIN